MHSDFLTKLVVSCLDGIFHVYVDKSADFDMAKRIVLDAKMDYPAACIAMVIFLNSLSWLNFSEQFVTKMDYHASRNAR